MRPETWLDSRHEIPREPQPSNRKERHAELPDGATGPRGRPDRLKKVANLQSVQGSSEHLRSPTADRRRRKRVTPSCCTYPLRRRPAPQEKSLAARTRKSA